MIDKIKLVFGEYGVGKAQFLTDKSLLQIAQEYRRTKARMRPLVRDDVKVKVPAECHVSKKVDGEFCVLAFDGEEAILVNPGGTVRRGLPLLKRAVSELKRAEAGRTVIAGELYVARSDGKRSRVHDVVRAAAQPQSEEDLESLHFAAFDIVSPPCRNYDETWMELNRIAPSTGSSFHVVPGKWVESTKLALEAYDEWVGREGEEGVVIRSKGGSFKVKPKHSIDAVVVGFSEGTGDRRGMVHDLLLALIRKDGSFHLLGRVGSGIGDDDRRSLLSDLKDEMVDSEYAEVNSDHVAYQMVKPKKVVEISCLDLISASTAGTPVSRMTLHWNEKAWEVRRSMPFVNVISPVFQRVRHDKQCVPEHVGVNQIERVLPILDAEVSVKDVKLPRSEILRRSVWVKEMKSRKMVRKLIVWKTNKSDVDSSYPAFVMHYTDFSPNRKSSLEKEVRIFNRKEQADRLWEEFVKSKVTAGWVKVSE